MTHREFLRRYSRTYSYIDLRLSGWRPEDPLPERDWWHLGSERGAGGLTRLWFQPRDVLWAVRDGLMWRDRVKLVEVLEQVNEMQGEIARLAWTRKPFGTDYDRNWVRRYCGAEPHPRVVSNLWSMPKYAFRELVERVDDLPFWGYVWWLVLRGKPYCFDDLRACRMFGCEEVEMERVRLLMFDMGWFVSAKSFPAYHRWMRAPLGVAMD